MSPTTRSAARQRRPPACARIGGFGALLTDVCADLARQMQLDAEGAGKAIDIEVTGAASEADAITAGRAVARSNLLKCAIAGRPELGPGCWPRSGPPTRV